jgi:tetratricopeptide (TPR) repeat protein
MLDKLRTWHVCLVLGVAVAAVFSGALNCAFVDYDDGDYVFSNPAIQHGLTAHSARWALTTGAASNWHPLTWLSHELDVSLYGLHPAGHHLTSLLLHAANAVLLLLLLRRLTGALWRSAFVAALFALHPLRVESVVWVSERKDVLSGLFFLLTIAAWLRYAEECKMQNAKCKMFYAGALVLFALGLMAKPMLVTLPFVLLLLDYWPLRRQAGPVRLLTEKIPFFILAAASSVVTYRVQQQGGAVSGALTLGGRLANAVISCVRYLGKTVWPVDLSVLYPHPGHWPAGQVAAAAIFLALVTALVVWRARPQPWLAVGWFWFLGMLAPAIGVVQVGLQSMADRYTYLPLCGVFIMVVWGANDCLGGTRAGKTILAILGGLAVTACAVLTPRQVRYWQNSETLFTRAVAVTKNNYLACNNLGFYLSNQGQYASAIPWYQRALAIKSDYAEALNNLGFALDKQGHYQEAVAQYELALSADPKLTEAHNNLGNALASLGRADDAVREYQTALQENPRHAGAHNNYGIALAMHGRLDEAIAQFHLALASQENYPGAHSNLGNALAAQGKWDDAAREYAVCLAADPADPQARNNLGNVFAQQGRLEDAAAQYRAALRLKPDNPETHFALGYALAKLGRRQEAEAELLLALQQRPDFPAARQQLEALRLGR